jgi:cell division protein FtsL
MAARDMSGSPRGGRRGSVWRGRTLVAAGLAGFVLVASGIIWRRGYGIGRAAEIRDLDRRRLQLEAERATLERDIAEWSSRSRLGPIVEQRLHMRVPDDSQVIVVPVDPSLPAH